MAITHGIVTRNVIAQAVADQVGSGHLVIKAGGTTLVTLAISFAAVSAGSISVNTVTPVAASVSGIADSFEVQNGGGTKVYGGTVTVTGGGGDMTLDNTSIASGQQIAVPVLQYIAPT